jgi:hypothetical protein
MEDYQLSPRDLTRAERQQARLKTADMAVDAADLRQLLSILGLDQDDNTIRPPTRQE